MSQVVRLAALGAALAFVSAAAVTPAPAGASYDRPGTNERVSVSSSGAQANNDSPIHTENGDAIDMTPDGRFVVFVSTATNLTPDGITTASVLAAGGGGEQLFVRDRLRHKTMLASPEPTVGTGGKVQYCTDAQDPAISDDGRYVVFGSSCQFLTPGQADANLNSDVFVHDIKTGAISRVSVAADGGLANGSSGAPTISANGRVVAFSSSSTNLTPMPCASDPTAQAICAARKQLPAAGSQVFVRDLVTKTTTLASQATGGGVADGDSDGAAVSPDGQFIEFTSVGNDLVPEDQNVCNPAYGTPSCPDVYVRDLKKKRTELVSAGLDGGPGNNESGGSGRRPHAISADNRYVAFRSFATNLVPNGGVVPAERTYVRDRRLGRTTQVSVDHTGQPISGSEFNLSRDGRYVTMDSTRAYGSCPAAGTSTNSPGLVTVHDNVTGGLDAVGWMGADGKPDDCKQDYYVLGGPISADGRIVAFYTAASNMVRGDTNNKWDAFVRDRGKAVGVGGLAASGSLSVAGASAFRRSGVVSAGDVAADVGTAQSALGLDLIGASLAYRPETSDLFVRIQVAQMPRFPLASPFVLYGVGFVASGTSYELRIGKSGLGATFGLYRRTATGWTHVRDLAGGYGTTGQEVVAALPLAAIGASDGARLADVRAFTALAPALGDGAADRIDQMSL